MTTDTATSDYLYLASSVVGNKMMAHRNLWFLVDKGLTTAIFRTFVRKVDVQPASWSFGLDKFVHFIHLIVVMLYIFGNIVWLLMLWIHCVAAIFGLPIKRDHSSYKYTGSRLPTRSLASCCCWLFSPRRHL